MALLIEWNDSLSVGVSEIDRQHMKLVGLINKLHQAMSEGHAKDVMSQILDEMISYTDEHFKTEERYFNQFKYIKTVEHMREHRNFVNTALQLQSDFKSGKLGISVGTMEFLKDWLTKHIQGSDKEYTKCFNENGLH